MSSPARITYAELAAALPAQGFDQSAAEYHGALCGALTTRFAEDVDVLQVLPPVEPDVHDLATGAVLNRLRDQALAALNDDEALPELLLPDDAQPLVLRAAAFGEWCQGFLFGLASRPGFTLAKASEEAQEVVKDFAEFTRLDLDEAGTDDDGQESAYTDLVEYVRVGAQLLFLELTPATNRAAA